MWIDPETLEVFYEFAEGLELVASTECPLTGRLEKAVRGAPELVDGLWLQTWVFEPLTPREVAQVEEAERVNERGAATNAEAAWVETEKTFIANNLLYIEDENPKAEPPFNAKLWSNYRINVMAWQEDNPDFPDSTKRPVRPA